MTRRQDRPTRLTRRSREIEPRECILIVCEGKKTEPNYFNRLRQVIRLPSAQVTIIPQGAAPITVVNQAVQMKHDRQRDFEAGREPCPYDQVWAVLDVEQLGQNPSLPQAIQKARDNELHVALSNPCFEFWLLLHFKRTGRAFANHDHVVRELKAHLPDYRKAYPVAEGIIQKRTVAAKHASDIDRQQWQHQPDRTQCNPCTDVYKLVEVLDEMAARRPFA